MRVTYTGYLSVTYMDYVDIDTGKVLSVEPGGTYNIRAVGFNAPDIPVDFKPAVMARLAKKEDKTEDSKAEQLTSVPEVKE